MPEPQGQAYHVSLKTNNLNKIGQKTCISMFKFNFHFVPYLGLFCLVRVDCVIQIR